LLWISHKIEAVPDKFLNSFADRSLKIECSGDQPLAINEANDR